MTKIFKHMIAATALASLTVPAMAQDEPEEPRTTYSVSLLKFANGADGRWSEIREQYILPARAAAGMPEQEVHWIMAGEWDIMILTEMPGGLATLDTHGNPNGPAFMEAMLELVGSQEELDALWEEMQGLVATSSRTFTHTHP